MHAGDHQMRLAHPMQRRIGEHRVELGDEIEGMAVDLADSEALHPRDGEQLVAEIDAEHIGARCLDLGGQRAIAAAKIENPFARLGAEHAEHRSGQLLHEAAVPRIVGGGPALHGLRRRGVEKRVPASFRLPRLVIQRRLRGARAQRRAGRTIGLVGAGEIGAMRLLPGARPYSPRASAARRRCDAARHAMPAESATARRGS